MRRTTVAALLVCLLPLGALGARRAPERAPDPAPSTGADPLGTRGSLLLNGRYSLWSVEVPLPGTPKRMEGAALAGFLSTDLYGRMLGFDMGYRVLSTSPITADGKELSEKTSYTAIEVQPDLNYVLFNRTPLFLSVGLGANVRINVLNLDESFSRSVSSWSTVAAGPNARARFFLGPNFYATASVFVGFLRVAGGWTAAGITTQLATPPAGVPEAFYKTGDIENLFVLNGMASFAWRPLEWLAVNAGFAYRQASFEVKETDAVSNNPRDRGPGNELDLQPFAGLEVLF